MTEAALAHPSRSPLRRVASWLVFPLTLGAGLWATWYFGQGRDNPIPVAIVVSLIAVVTIAGLERVLPHRREWLRGQGDVKTDVWHTLLNQILLSRALNVMWAAIFAGTAAALAARFGTELWPHHWPILAQLFTMLAIAEFGRYWLHRASHRVPWLWRLHAVHHSPRRLYFLNAGRVHPIEKAIYLVPEALPFIVLGTNVECLAMYATFNSIHGLFQHGNVDVRLGPLNYVFSMAELHRWHHSQVVGESDHNFGNNLIIWDLIFGTRFLPREREVGPLGLRAEGYPASFWAQVAAPFGSRDISQPVGEDAATKAPALPGP